MKTTLVESIVESKVDSLFKDSYIPIVVNFFVAGFLAYMCWEVLNLDIAAQWGSLVVSSSLVSVLGFSMYVRKRAIGSLNFNKWGNYLCASSALTSILFGSAYTYMLLTGEASFFPTIAFTVAMHLSCLLIPTFSSKKVMAWIALPIALPVISTLMWLRLENSVALGVSLAVFTGILFVISFQVSFTLKKSFETNSQYKEALTLANKYKHKLSTSTIEDPQTQILNRRFFDLMINQEIRRAKRSEQTLTLALIQIDCFDDYNKHYGEAKANKCLRTVARILSDATPRGGEYMTRFGDDMFALIVPNVLTQEAIAFTEKVMTLVNDASIEHNHTKVEGWDRVSISIGIAEFSSHNIINVDEMITQANNALGTAISLGCNNTQVFAANVLPAKQYKDESQAIERANDNARPNIA